MSSMVPLQTWTALKWNTSTFNSFLPAFFGILEPSQYNEGEQIHSLIRVVPKTLFVPFHQLRPGHLSSWGRDNLIQTKFILFQYMMVGVQMFVPLLEYELRPYWKPYVQVRPWYDCYIITSCKYISNVKYLITRLTNNYE